MPLLLVPALPCLPARLPARLPGLQGLAEGQELPPEVITSLFEALTYDCLLEGALAVLSACVAFCAIPLHSCWRFAPWQQAWLPLPLRPHQPARSPLRHPPADAECADALAGALCTLCTRYDLALAEPGAARYPGAYRLLAHPSVEARRLVSHPRRTLGTSTHCFIVCRPSRSQ